MDTQHSSIPWEIDDWAGDSDLTIRSDGRIIATAHAWVIEARANAEFIVRAVNAYDTLVAALTNVIRHQTPDVCSDCIRQAADALRGVPL